MNQVKLETLKEERIFDEHFKIDKAFMQETDAKGEISHYTRLKLTRPDAVAVLLFNEDARKIILVRQHRYPVADKTNDYILEAVAGKIDAGETPQQAAIREVREEVGYEITDRMLYRHLETFPSPGYSSETIHIFVAFVRNEHKISIGGGVEGEHENIDIVEMDPVKFKSMIHDNQIKDGKTIIASHLLQC